MYSKELIETKLEPEIASVAIGGLDTAAVVSIAVSLKRIADAICGDEKNTGIHLALVEMSNPIPR